MTDIGKTITEVYISTGAQNVMYTLRQSRSNRYFTTDFYICNLSLDLEKAIAKARDYFERIHYKHEFGEVFFNDCPEYDPRERRKGMTAKQTDAVDEIERGFFPFGKHRGTKIEDAPDGYVLWWADKANEEDVVVKALASFCMGVALERNLIAKREEKRAEWDARDRASNHVGVVGERLTFENAVAISIYHKASDYDDGYWINKFQIGDDIIVYYGKKLAEKGDTVTLKATIKRHNEWEGKKTTVIQRPKVL
jgi:uncharacterized protein (DUF3820 family)